MKNAGVARLDAQASRFRPPAPRTGPRRGDFTRTAPPGTLCTGAAPQAPARANDQILCRPPLSLRFPVVGGWFSRPETSSNSVIILHLPSLCSFKRFVVGSSRWYPRLSVVFSFLRKKPAQEMDFYIFSLLQYIK